MKKRDLITLWILAAPVMGAVFAPAPASAGETHSRPELADGPYRKQRSEIRRLIDQLSHPDLTPFLKPFQEIEKEIAGGKPGPTVKERIIELREGIRARLRSEARLRNLYALSYSTRTLHPYCETVEQAVSASCNDSIKRSTEHCELRLTVNEEGALLNPRLTGNPESRVGKALLSSIKALNKVETPPFAPLNLIVDKDSRGIKVTYEPVIDYDRYMYKVEKHLNKGIKRSGVNAEKGGSQKDCHATVSFSVENDGAPAHIKLVKSSEDKAFDDACIKAVKDAAPLPRPGKFPGDAITIRHIF
ncbi:MAG: energy transducer TonB [Cyanobacteriota/Melainabacteria group bacterium]